MTLNLNANSSLARGKALPWKLSAMLNHQLLNEQISSSKATGEFSHSAPLHLHHAVLQRLPSRMQLVSPSCEIATFLLQSLMQLYVASALQVSHLHFAAAGTGFQIWKVKAKYYHYACKGAATLLTSMSNTASSSKEVGLQDSIIHVITNYSTVIKKIK